MLHAAKPVQCCLRRDTSAVTSYYYAPVGSPGPGALCHYLVRTQMDDFDGLFLILPRPHNTFASLYVAGYQGSGNTEDGVFFTPPETTGRLLNDSLLQIRTSSSQYEQQDHVASVDTVIQVVRLDARAHRFILMRTDTVHAIVNRPN